MPHECDNEVRQTPGTMASPAALALFELERLTLRVDPTPGPQKVPSGKLPPLAGPQGRDRSMSQCPDQPCFSRAGINLFCLECSQRPTSWSQRGPVFINRKDLTLGDGVECTRLLEGTFLTEGALKVLDISCADYEKPSTPRSLALSRASLGSAG